MPDTDVIKRSVTSGDYSTSPQGGAFLLNVGIWPRTYALRPSLDGLSLKDSDMETITTPDHEAIWAGSLAIAITKVSSLAWEIEGDIPLRTKRGHDLLMGVDAGRGWVSFISKILQDFLLTNNGAFIEIVRATTSENSQIIGLIPLDSLRCTRTGDPAIPVTYADLKGRTHELRAADVLEFADMPSSRASMFGSGKCAAARAYKSIYKLACIEDYISDKVSGRRPLAINLINGLNAAQLQAVLDTAQSQADAKGVIAYMGAIMATIPGEAAPGVATIPLADFPDNFNRRDELDIAILSYANNLGMDVQDLQPLTGRALGTGAQSQVLDEKSKGKGLAAFRQQFVHALNTWVLPDATTLVFVEKDWRDKKLTAEFNQMTENYTSDAVKNGILTAPQGLQALVDANVYPDEFLPSDITPDTTLADTEKPEDVEVPQPNAAVPAPTPEAPPVIPPVKEVPTAQVELKETQPIQPGNMRVIIKRREGPTRKEMPGGNSVLMPILIASMLANSGEELKGVDMSLLSDWIDSLRKSARKEKAEEKTVQQVKGVEAVMSEDGTSLTILMPADFFTNKQDGQPQQDIVINIPAPIVNITNPAPVVNMPAPVVNMPQQRPPTVNVTPTIQVNMPEPKRGEFTVQRDNYGNVLGITEKQ